MVRTPEISTEGITRRLTAWRSLPCESPRSLRFRPSGTFSPRAPGFGKSAVYGLAPCRIPLNSGPGPILARLAFVATQGHELQTYGEADVSHMPGSQDSFLQLGTRDPFCSLRNCSPAAIRHSGFGVAEPVLRGCADSRSRGGFAAAHAGPAAKSDQQLGVLKCRQFVLQLHRRCEHVLSGLEQSPAEEILSRSSDRAVVSTSRLHD